MQNAGGCEYIQNDLVKISKHGSLLLPHQLSIREYGRLIMQKGPFNIQSTFTSTVSVFNFPEEFDLWNRKNLDLGALQGKAVKNYVVCKYKKVGQDIFQRTAPRKVPYIPRIYNFHSGPLDETNYFAENLISSGANVVDLVSDIITKAGTTTVDYVLDFEFDGASSQDFHNPFAFGNFECPLFSDLNLPLLEVFTKPWTFFAKPYTSTPFHIDDFGLSSTMYHLAGSTKIWLIIPNEDKIPFQDLLQNKLPKLVKPYHIACDSKVSQAKLLITPRQLENWGVGYIVVMQNPGNYLMLAGNSYHQVVNCGFNITRSMSHNDQKYFTLQMNDCECAGEKHGEETPYTPQVEERKWNDFEPKLKKWFDLAQKKLDEDYSLQQSRQFFRFGPSPSPTPTLENFDAREALESSATSHPPTPPATQELSIRTLPATEKPAQAGNKRKAGNVVEKENKAPRLQPSRVKVSCQFCGKQCAKASNLRRHLKLVCKGVSRIESSSE